MQAQPSIQMTLFDYFMDQEHFTINDAIDAVKRVKEVKEPSVRGRIYEGIDKGLFERVGKGVYTVKRTDSIGNESSCLLINGDGRDLSMFEDNSFDALITDHPYKLDKSLKGGNRDFANYDSFQYEQKDLDEKFRVLKPGCFLVEFLPEENSDNYKYIYKIKEMAERAGLEYYSTVPWKKGDFVANTGRKAKNTEQVIMFTKGKARSLKLDAKKNKEMIENMRVLKYEKQWENVAGKHSEITYDLLIDTTQYDFIENELNKAFENWMYNSCENSILEKGHPGIALEQVPLGDYMLMWLDELKLSYIDISKQSEGINYELLSASEFNKTITNILKEVAPEKLYYMSGTNGMLPTVFDIEPVKKEQKIHQAEKPRELLEQIINYVTQPNEKILDQFAGSGVLGEAALNTNRDSVLIESDKDTFDNMVERLKEKDSDTPRKELRVV